MWVPKQLILCILRQLHDLERRVKRLELIEFEGAKNKIARLQDEAAGSGRKDRCSTIEEVINKAGQAR